MFRIVRSGPKNSLLGTPLILVLAFFLLGATYYPPGIGDGLRGPAFAIERGLYPGQDEGECCWLGDSAVLALRAPADAASVIFTIFVADLQPFRNAPEALNVAIDRAPARRVCCFERGIHQFAVPLPAKRPSIIRISIVSTIWFVPKNIGLNDDTRRLSVLLRSVDYRDATGTPIERNAIAGDVATTSPIALLPYAILLLLAFALTRRRAALGLGVLLLAEPLGGDMSLGPTTTNAFKVALVGVVLALLFKRSWRDLLTDRRAQILLGSLFFLALTAALSLHDAPFRAPAVREVLKHLEYALAFVAAFVAFRSDPDSRLVRNGFAAIAVLVCLSALVQESTGSPEGVYIAGHNVARIAGFLDGPNQLAGWIEIVGPVLMATAALATSASNLLLPAMAAITGILTFSRAGSVAVLLSMSVSAMRSFAQRRVAIGLVLGASLAVVGALGWRALAHGDASLDTSNFNGGLGTRSDLWHAAVAMWRAHPLLGVGAGNYEFLLGHFGLVGVRTHANSWYLQALAETGTLGFIATLGVAAATILTFARRRDLFGVAAFAASIALCLHGIFDDVVFYPKVGAMWWLLLGIAAAWLPPKQSEPESLPLER
jgi:O-antigen ligase